MVGLKEICALLAAGSMGAGGVVAVQQVKPSGIHRAKPRPAPRAIRASAPKPRPAARLDDCPVIASSLGNGFTADLAPIAPFDQTPMAILTSPGGLASIPGSGGGIFVPPGGGGSGGSELPGGGGISPVPPAVPEPAAWAMMVSGFGLIGLAMRRTRTNAAAHTA